MAYRIDPGKPLGDEIRRIASRQLDQALACCERPTDVDEAVHQVRKRCKRIRSLLRIVHVADPKGLAEHHRRIRDAAGRVGPARDTTATTQAFEALLHDAGADLPAAAVERWRRALLDWRQAVRGDDQRLRHQLEATGDGLREAQRGLRELDLPHDFDDVIAPSVARIYRRGRAAMHEAYAKPSSVRFHEWRKHVKAHGHHMELLRRAWPDEFEARSDALDELGERLGDDHDLAVLADVLDEVADEPEALTELIEVRRRALQRDAKPLGQRLYAERPKALARRLRKYWAAAG